VSTDVDRCHHVINRSIIDALALLVGKGELPDFYKVKYVKLTRSPCFRVNALLLSDFLDNDPSLHTVITLQSTLDVLWLQPSLKRSVIEFAKNSASTTHNTCLTDSTLTTSGE